MGYVQAGVQIVGLNEAVAGLKAMGELKELQTLNLEVGKRVVEQARPLVPYKTGALQSTLRASRRTKGVVVFAGRDPSVPYANVQNWGWFYDAKRMIRKNIKPTQFMNKGAIKVKPWIQDNYIKRLVALYEKHAKH